MDMNENAKELGDDLKKAGNAELCSRIIELEGEVIELTRQLRAAERDLARLQAKPTTTAKLTFREPFYYAADGSMPYCPRCFEAQKLASRLHRLFSNPERTRYDCKHCGEMYLVDRSGRRLQLDGSARKMAVAWSGA